MGCDQPPCCVCVILWGAALAAMCCSAQTKVWKRLSDRRVMEPAGATAHWFTAHWFTAHMIELSDVQPGCTGWALTLGGGQGAESK